MRKTVVFDFDGVIHSYQSGWKGADKVPDPVVPGIREAIADLRQEYLVVVVSTRCSTAAGMKAVRDYLAENDITVDDVMAEKPPAVCYVDDRAIRFDGKADTIPYLVRGFKSWVQAGRNPYMEAIENEFLKTARQEERKEVAPRFRPCQAKRYNGKEFEDVTGRFHGFFPDYEEFETGPGNFTVALVEKDDGTVVACIPDTVRFLDRGN